MTDPEPDAPERRLRVKVSGRVQGVNFRAATAQQARACGVAGWVTNRADGSVEAVFEGPAEAVARMLAFARKGPSWARVERLESGEEPIEGEVGFQIRY